MKNNDPKKILVIKLCCIGDLVFLLPALRDIKNTYPQAKLTYLCSSWIKELVEQVSYVDDVIVYDAPFLKKSFIKKIQSTIKLFFEIRSKKIDVVFIFHRNALFSLFCWLAGIKQRLGFENKLSFLLTDEVNFDSTKFEAERYLDVIAKFGIKSADEPGEFEPSELNIKLVNEKLFKYSLKENDSLIGIIPGGGENPGTSMSIKRWYPENYSDLCGQILANGDYKIILVGSTSDKDLCEGIRGNAKFYKDRIINLAGEFSLGELPALLKRCNLVIGVDTGPAHIANAVGVKTLFLFGPSDPRLVAPKNSKSLYIWKQVECCPCYTPDTVIQKKNFVGNIFVCRTGTHECMKNILVDEVYLSFRYLQDKNNN
ncbi:MAG: glycosyltransferase family 9 protein [Bacteroidota bacterium]|nr:glycosyltransferase family 9 protein [Bacteroidota bacterium]